MTDILQQLKTDESFRRFPYRCSEGVLTIGYGRNVDRFHGGLGVNEIEASLLLRNDIMRAEKDLASLFPRWSGFDQVRKNALINMRFQLGAGGFRSFRRMITAVNQGSWIVAAREAMESKWASQTPRRASRVVMELRDGVSLF